MRMFLIALTAGLVGTVLLGVGCRNAAAPAGGSGIGDAATVTVVNSKCPIMGTALDRTKVPPSLVQDFEGQKVGFCCAMCPPQWRALSDDQKRAKLAAAMSGSTPPVAGREGHSQ